MDVYCYEIAETYDFEIIEMETDKNHVHLLISCNPRFNIMKCVTAIKSITAKTLFSKFWSRSTFISTVGSVSLETVKKYIENQGK